MEITIPLTLFTNGMIQKKKGFNLDSLYFTLNINSGETEVRCNYAKETAC